MTKTTTERGQLTPREQEIARLLATGHTRQQIADRFGIKITTVDSYRKVVYLKAGARDRASLFQWARRRGLLGIGFDN